MLTSADQSQLMFLLRRLLVLDGQGLLCGHLKPALRGRAAKKDMDSFQVPVLDIRATAGRLPPPPTEASKPRSANFKHTPLGSLQLLNFVFIVLLFDFLIHTFTK